MPDEQTLALELDRAIAGEDAVDEARELAALLRAATDPVRFAVAETEIERALADARSPRVGATRRRLLPSLALAAAAIGVAAAVWIARTPGVDVQAHAAQAVDATFFVVERVRPVRLGTFPVTDITGYVDGRTGRTHLRIGSARGPAAELVIRQDGRVERWDAASNTITLSPSCVELAAACTEAVDPFGLYVRAVQAGPVATSRSGRNHRLTIRRGRVTEIVVVDRQSFLPSRIEWLQDGRPFSVAHFTALERQRKPVGQEAWGMSEHPGARVVQLSAHGAPVHVLAVRPSKPTRALRWLGPSYDGRRARVYDVTLTGGHATRIDYGPVVVWNYRAIVPPQVVPSRGLPAKVFAIPGGVVHATFAQAGGQVADATFGDGNVAVVSTSGDKADVIRAVQQLTRPGSP